MKKIYLVAVAPLVAGALGACSHPHPDFAKDPPIVSAAPHPIRPDLQPNFGPLVRRNEPPPPISGGTLAMSPDRTTAVASDPDRDRVYVVDLKARTLTRTVPLPTHSEPGRAAVDDDGHAHVVLRRTGGIATIDLATGELSIRQICVAPRGIAFDRAEHALRVACASGELVTVPLRAAHVSGVKRTQLVRDLRDVVMQRDGSMIVTTFRTASRIRVWNTGDSAGVPRTFDNENLAWRAVAVPVPADGPLGDCSQRDCSDGTAFVHQAPTPQDILVSTDPGGYGRPAPLDPSSDSSECSMPHGILTTRLELGLGFVDLPDAVLPVDLATNGRELVVVAAGNAFTRSLPQLIIVLAEDLRNSPQTGCVATTHGNVPGQAVAAAFDADDALVVQTREPAALHVMTKNRRGPAETISLATDSVADTGHAIFHANAGGFIACASCHAEGGDDGHVWGFDGIGPRRTPSLLGTVAGTEPFHWDGDQKDLRDLVDHVFVERMSGPAIDDERLGALGGWLFALPSPSKLHAPSEGSVRGAAVFQERCASCHAGAMLTNNATVDVGTGGAFQVPSLVGVGWRQPLMHAGCARTLIDRFDPECGGAYHGDTRTLAPARIQDLVDFLETL